QDRTVRADEISEVLVRERLGQLEQDRALRLEPALVDGRNDLAAGREPPGAPPDARAREGPPWPDRATVPVERDRHGRIGPDLRDRLARQHRQVLALDRERVGEGRGEPHGRTLVPPVDPAGSRVLRCGDHDPCPAPGREVGPEHQRRGERVPEGVTTLQEDLLARGDDRVDGFVRWAASVSAKNGVNETSSVASRGTSVTSIPWITSLAASGSTHTLELA